MSRVSWLPILATMVLAAIAAVVHADLDRSRSVLDRLARADVVLVRVERLLAPGRPDDHAEAAALLVSLRSELEPVASGLRTAAADAAAAVRALVDDANRFGPARRAVTDLHDRLHRHAADARAVLDARVDQTGWLMLAVVVIAGVAAATVPWGWRRARHHADTERQNELLAAATRSTDEGIMVSSFGGAERPAVIEFVNQSFARMCGRPADELVGRPISALRDCLVTADGAADIERTFSDGASSRLETVVERPDGGRSYWEWHLSPVRDRGGRTTHLVSSLRDITRRRTYEDELRRTADALQQANRQLRDNQAQLVQSEKMASLGQLAAGVAHEINNPIGYVRANLDTLSEDLGAVRRLLDALQRVAAAVAAGDADAAGRLVDAADAIADEHLVPARLEDLDPMLDDMREGLERVRDIVLDLREFARPADAEPEPTDVNRQLGAALKITHNALKYRCTVRTSLGRLPIVRSHPGQLTQVFTNLLVNAADAIEHRGEIAIDSRVDDGWIVVRVSDDGSGIAPEHIGEIFSPFFTTKPVGQGTGLGLAVSYGIVMRLGGTIDVASAVGVGTTFTIRLPIVAPPSASVPASDGGGSEPGER